jgi:hypothetical protein
MRRAIVGALDKVMLQQCISLFNSIGDSFNICLLLHYLQCMYSTAINLCSYLLTHNPRLPAVNPNANVHASSNDANASRVRESDHILYAKVPLNNLSFETYMSVFTAQRLLRF